MLLVPLGETNEEFYQGIYTEQSLSTRPLNPQPPPLPNRPPAWRTDQPTTSDNNQEERDGPSWVCSMCTFDNHPLMNKCEECDMPRLLNSGGTGTTGSSAPIPSILPSSSTTMAAPVLNCVSNLLPS